MFELEIFETFEYTTPEEILKQPITDKIDIWAIGILMYRLLTFEHPFKGSDNKETEKNIKNYPMRQLPQTLSLDIRLLILQLLVKVPEQRPTVIDLLRNKLIQPAIYKLFQELCPQVSLTTKIYDSLIFHIPEYFQAMYNNLS